jgi:predicted GNAT family acetyltransferase
MDVHAVTALDRATVDDYPGDVATAHEALTPARATPAAAHRGWGAFTTESELVAMTFADIGPNVTETDFTVVHRDRRRQGLGSAVKAACLLALADEGHVVFRTGGSMDNPASIAANRAVGYELDEEWLTFATVGRPAR